MKLMFLRRCALMFILVLATALGTARVAGAFPVAAEKLTPNDPVTGGEFGRSVAIDGDLVAVGLGGPTDETSPAPGPGAVYVYQRNGDSYVFQQKLTAPDPEPNAQFGRAVALNGNLLVVGARFASSETVTNAGAAYVFLRRAGAWVFEAKLTAGTDAQSDDNFGRALALSGNLLAVTARKETASSLSQAGAAYVFERIGGVWTRVARVTPNDLTLGGYFGQSVDLRGNLMVVGARNSDGAAAGSGAAYVFNRIGNEWVQTAKLAADDGANGDQFAFNLAIMGNQVVVGARRASSRTGAAYVFESTPSGWIEVQKLTASDGQKQDEFGQGVAITGDFLAISAWRAKIDGNSGQGAVYLFRRAGQQWVEADKFAASDGAAGDQLGHSLSAHGDTIIAGANQVGDPVNLGPGYVYIFSK